MKETTNAEKAREIGHLFAQSLITGVRAEQRELQRLGVPMDSSMEHTDILASEPTVPKQTPKMVGKKKKAVA